MALFEDPSIRALVDSWQDEARIATTRSLLHRVLAARAFIVTRDIRARIDNESDLARLEAWHDAAVTAASIVDVFHGRAFKEGRIEQARSLLHRVLAAKSFAVTTRIQSRINSEADLPQLEDWLVAAMTAKSIGDVIRDG